MFYHNTRYKFQLADQSPDNIAGGIIAASAMARPQLARRAFTRYPYLQHRLFDPQLYLADLNASGATESVAKLGTYEWFRCQHEEFDSGQRGGLKRWKDEQTPRLLEQWPGEAATDEEEIEGCVRAAVTFQRSLGCEAIILPSPMSRIPSNYEIESRWLDAGLEVCGRRRRGSLPLYATVAIADTALRQLRPLQNAFLQTITAQIAAREDLAGAYIVIAQESEDAYICKNPDTLLSLLVIVDDIVRGAGLDAVVNYVGAFGAVAFAVGARVWSSGFYRSQRRLRTSDFDDNEGRVVPRYYSTRLLGDVGVEHDLQTLARNTRTRRVLKDTAASLPLNNILRGGGNVADVPSWEYAMGNTTAAIAHYNSCMQSLGSVLDALEPSRRLDVVNRRLVKAEGLAVEVREVVQREGHRQVSKYTDVASQRTWREVFETWRSVARV